MYLIQIFLPLRDNVGTPIAQRHFRELANELSERFGGLTAYARSPATGLWKNRKDGHVKRDDILIYEVLSKRLERQWWKLKRQALQKTFRQREILIRGHAIIRL